MDDVTRNYGCTHFSSIHPANKSIFASFEVTDSTSTLPYSSVLLQFGSKRGETDCSHRRHQDSPVYRQKVNESKLKTAMPSEHPQVGSSCQKPGLEHKFQKIRFNTNSGNQIFG